MTEVADAAAARPARDAEAPLLDIDAMSVSIGRDDSRTAVVDGVSLSLRRGEALGIVGESGSGKSLTALAIMGLLPTAARLTDGRVEFDGRSLIGLDEQQWSSVRGAEIAMVFQDPLSALNPCLRVGYQIAEMFVRHAGERPKAARERAVELMNEVGIPDASNRAYNYPHQFSGGMRQRIMIAMALALHPKLLIADEPTTALDVTVQAQILRILHGRRVAEQLGLVIISHDLGVIARTAQNVAVMYAGRIVESGPVGAVYSRPAHPYTKGLMSAAPVRGGGRRLIPIVGQPPDPFARPAGCSFHPRCPLATDESATSSPSLRPVADDHHSACHYAEQVADQEVVGG